MTLYSVALFAHVVSVLVLFAALSFEGLTLFHLRRASSLAQARLWIDPIPRLTVFVVGSMLVVFFTGIYLAVRMEAGSLAWPKVAAMALLLMAPLGLVTSRRMRTIRHLCASDQTRPEALGRLRDPFLKVSLGIRVAVILGIVLLMTAKPELAASIAIIAASALVGLATALLLPGRGTALSAADSDPPY